MAFLCEAVVLSARVAEKTYVSTVPWSILAFSACFSFLDGTFSFYHPHNPIRLLFSTK